MEIQKEWLERLAKLGNEAEKDLEGMTGLPTSFYKLVGYVSSAETFLNLKQECEHFFWPAVWAGGLDQSFYSVTSYRCEKCNLLVECPPSGAKYSPSPRV